MRKRIVISLVLFFLLTTIISKQKLLISKFNIKEIPIIFRDRKKGISKIPKIETLRTLKNLFLLKINE